MKQNYVLQKLCVSEAAVGRARRRRYPDCDFVAWGKPLAEKCPECGSSYLIEKWLKAGPVAQCPNGECKFKKELPQEQTA